MNPVNPLNPLDPVDNSGSADFAIKYMAHFLGIGGPIFDDLGKIALGEVVGC